MNEERSMPNNENSIEVDVDVRRLLKTVWKKAWLVAVVAILCAAASLLVTVSMITPQYQSSVMFYVQNKSSSTSTIISSSDITVAKSLVDTYIVILKSRTCLDDIIDHAELDCSKNELEKMISASSKNSTEVFEVVVTNPDPKEAQKIANAIADVLPSRLTAIVEGTTVQVIDRAARPSEPSSPNVAQNTIIGFLLGAVLTVGLIVVSILFDNTIRTEEDVSLSCSHPILAMIPDMEARSKGGSYYGQKSKKSVKKSVKKKQGAASSGQNPLLIGEEISFAASEAYKLLRTKIQFSFADNQKCHIIGVSSSFAGEGKSSSAANIAYTIAQTDKRVLLIDCDMRRPSLAAKLKIRKVPGLSNYLSDRFELGEIIQSSGAQFESAEFKVISAGQNPPNPLELLGSEKMGQMLNELKETFDYIILDLPPVGEVSDALVAAKFTDGMLLVACQGYCSRNALMNTVKQFEFVNAKILGIVMNRVVESSGSYGYDKKYGKKYYGT